MEELFVPDDRRRITLAEARAILFEADAKWLARLTPESREESLRSIEKEWDEFRLQIQPGDEIWEYLSPPAKWKVLMGWHGIELVRSGETMANILIRMN